MSATGGRSPVERKREREDEKERERGRERERVCERVREICLKKYASVTTDLVECSQSYESYFIKYLTSEVDLFRQRRRVGVDVYEDDAPTTF